MSDAVIQPAPALAGKYLTFRLAGETYGLPILKVQEIVRLMKITWVPKAPPFILGVVNLRGKVIPVMGARLKFGMAEVESGDRACIVIVQILHDRLSATLGLLVDEVSEVMQFGDGQVDKTPEMGGSVDTSFILGIGRSEDEGTVILLDIDRIFSRHEVEEMGRQQSES